LGVFIILLAQAMGKYLFFCTRLNSSLQHNMDSNFFSVVVNEATKKLSSGFNSGKCGADLFFSKFEKKGDFCGIPNFTQDST